jgi:hypothetical protein
MYIYMYIYIYIYIHISIIYIYIYIDNFPFLRLMATLVQMMPCLRVRRALNAADAATSLARGQHRMRINLRKARSISIHQDARKSLLAIRFLSCDSSLICSSGLLGVFNMAAKFDMTAKNIKQATLDIVSNTCTERRADSPNAPKAYTLRPYCDKALVRHVSQRPRSSARLAGILSSTSPSCSRS